MQHRNGVRNVLMRTLVQGVCICNSQERTSWESSICIACAEKARWRAELGSLCENRLGGGRERRSFKGWRECVKEIKREGEKMSAEGKCKKLNRTCEQKEGEHRLGSV